MSALNPITNTTVELQRRHSGLSQRYCLDSPPTLQRLPLATVAATQRTAAQLPSAW